MVAAPIEIDGPEEPMPDKDFPWQPPYTVDVLFELPSDGLRYEVLGGSLVVSPSPTPRHNGIAQRLSFLIHDVVPDLELLQNTAVGMPDGDGPVPDLLLTTANINEHPRWLPASVIHTVVEVVSPSSARNDRLLKTELYAEAGIPCYWRIEQKPWKEHLGPVPAIVVRLRDKDGEWHQTIAPAGVLATLPVVVDSDGTVVTVELDPAILAR